MTRSSFLFSKNTVLAFACGCLLTASFAFKIWNDSSPAIAISLTHHNVFYVGIYNPTVILTRGLTNPKISAVGVELEKTDNSDHNFNVRATKVGEATITVSADNGLSQTFHFWTKRIPDPIPRLGAKYRSCSLGNGEFKAQAGIAAVIENFGFDAKCDLRGFSATRLSQKLDPENRQNTGARFNPPVAAMIQKAVPGDTYFFDEIRARCPGDEVPRHLGSLIFRIR